MEKIVKLGDMIREYVEQPEPTTTGEAYAFDIRALFERGFRYIVVHREEATPLPAVEFYKEEP